LAESKFLHNLRFRFLVPDDMKGQPTICARVPNNPTNPMSFVEVPIELEIELLDPDNDMKPAWFPVPFHLPEKPIFQVDQKIPYRGKKN
jgi:hypothetical protein